jgi:hypothetical protein
MSSLYNDIEIDKIETDIMSVLYANMDTTFTQFSLFNKLIRDKYDFKDTMTVSIHPNFKSKFLLVVRCLSSKYDDIKITKENNMYNITCLSGTDIKPNISTEEKNPPTKPKVKSESEFELESNLNKSDITMMYDYICENNLEEYIKWSDPIDGNSLFHELVINNNIKQIESLIEKNLFDYMAMNNFKQTPIDLIKSPQLSNVITMGLVKKLNQTKEELCAEKANVSTLTKNINNNLNYYKSDEYKIKIINETKYFDIISIKTKKYHSPVKICILSILFYYIMLRYFS